MPVLTKSAEEYSKRVGTVHTICTEIQTFHIHKQAIEIITPVASPCAQDDGTKSPNPSEYKSLAIQNRAHTA
jgi:hypothetical protein